MVFDGCNIKTYTVNLKIAPKVEKHNLYMLTHTYIQSAVQDTVKGETKMEETKPTKSISAVEESAEQKNIKLGIAFCVVFSVGFCSGVFAVLSGIIG
jgi:hypothetical protein